MTRVSIKNADGEIILKEYEIDIAKPLLSQLENAGVEIPNACRAWICASCMCNAEQGGEHLVKNLRGEPGFPLADEEIMTCIWGVTQTDETIILQTI